MEYCGKGDLYHFMNDTKETMGWDEFFKFAIELTDGLCTLHSVDPPIVHRKNNIFL